MVHYTRTLKTIIKSHISDLCNELDNTKKKLNHRQDNNILNQEIELLAAYSESIKSIQDITKQKYAFELIKTLGSLESEITVFIDSMKLICTIQFQTPIISVLSTILSKIKTISSRLWQLLSQTMKLKKWSIAGNANINILGFSGGVALQLTFEK